MWRLSCRCRFKFHFLVVVGWLDVIVDLLRYSIVVLCGLSEALLMLAFAVLLLWVGCRQMWLVVTQGGQCECASCEFRGGLEFSLDDDHPGFAQSCGEVVFIGIPVVLVHCLESASDIFVLL